MELQQLITTLKAMSAGVERELTLYRWKHKNTEIGLFSTAHGGDCAGNLIKALSGPFEWEDRVIVNGKKIVLEYEQNFNLFVTFCKNTL